MSVFNADAISGGSAAGGIFNLSDAALIALVVNAGPMATDASRILNESGTVPGSSDEIWGLLVG